MGQSSRLVDAPVPLNAVCPYFTMFPLRFPLRVLARGRWADDSVLDPFCGRGTTNLAARLFDMPSTGIDSHPVAAAVAEAKLVTTTPQAITGCLDEILATEPAVPTPRGEFWQLAYHKDTLAELARVRSALQREPLAPERVALRAILLGGLHGPLTKSAPSYLSNQCPRTYAPKPRYAVKYWNRHGLRPPRADIRKVVARRAARHYAQQMPAATCSRVLLADSRDPTVFDQIRDHQFGWVITSPPYYRMRTYLPDQWLRLWLLGGLETVDYSQSGQVCHQTPESFVADLRRVWDNCASVSRSEARLVVRFGSFPDCRLDPGELLRASLAGTGWRIQTRRDAGPVPAGRRQAEHFGVTSTPRKEFDLWAVHARDPR